MPRLGGALAALTRRCAARPRRVLAVWALAAIVGGALVPTLQERLHPGGFAVEDSASGEVRRLLEREYPHLASSLQVAVPAGPRTRELTRRVAGELRETPGVLSAEVLAPGSAERPGVVGLVPAGDGAAATDLVPELRRRAELVVRPGRAYVGGVPAYFHDVERETRRDLTRAERFALPITLVVLVAAFGSLAAALVSLTVGVAGLATAFAFLLALTAVLDVQLFVLNLASLVGFGVGVDYALLMVSRIRSELEAGRGTLDAIAVAGEHAGHAIVTSGLAVVLALSGLFAMGMSSWSGMALGTMTAVVVTVIAALTLLPAVAALTHRRLGPRARRRNRSAASPSGERLARLVVRRPLAVSLAAMALLLVVALPATDMHFKLPGPAILPEGSGSRVAAELGAQALGPGGDAPVMVALPLRGGDSAARALAAEARRSPSVTGVATYLEDPRLRSRDGQTGIVRVTVAADPEADPAQDVVEALRRSAPEGALVGGLAAERFDEIERYEDRLPFAVGGVLLATALIMMLAFRSLLIPLKAILATLLSVAAALGASVWVFQDGHLAGLLGFQEIGGLPAFLPIFLFPIVFGLSMDYEVFLLSRIAEERRNGKSDREAIVAGLASTARVITGAAAVMVSVAAAFAGTNLLPTQASGFGMSVAVILDATVVRVMLVPALLALLGAAAWWWPRRRGGRREEAAPVAGSVPR